MAGINNRNNSLATFNYIDGGAIDLSAGMTDDTNTVKAKGFFISIAPDGTEGLIKVKTLGEPDTERLMPFFYGWNPILITEVVVDDENTAEGAYWAK
ncbi:MAG TPA: hypothetical protein VMV77_06420 [Bacteroidales bacterium]|nr:hypothetical protein [Bacteroidales bacterium]